MDGKYVRGTCLYQIVKQISVGYFSNFKRSNFVVGMFVKIGE